MNKQTPSRKLLAAVAAGLAGILRSCLLPSCTKVRAKSDSPAALTVGVTKVARKSLQRQITLSSELVPFQEIDVYAKESGFVKNLYVDYGSRVQAGQLMATLEIPELEAQLQEDQASIKNAMDEVSRAEHQLKRYQAQYKVLHLEYTRLNGVFESQPGLVAQQEVDDAQGKDLAAASQVDAGESCSGGRAEPASGEQGQAYPRPSAVRLRAHHGAFRRRGDPAVRQPGNFDAGRHELQHPGHAAGPAIPG